ncbi:TetR/AcrR family transcriptional regulator, partial [Nocardia thailandica]
MPGKPTERRRRPTQERAIATREHILTTAAALFAERGIANTSTNRIAAAAEISIGTLYRYFEDRDIIVDELLGRLQGEIERGFAERVFDIPGLHTAVTVAEYTSVIAQILDVFAEVLITNAALVRALAGRVHFYRSGIPELEPRLRVLVKVVLIQA